MRIKLIALGPHSYRRDQGRHMETEERIRFLETNLARQISWIGSADSKSAFGFVLNTGMLGVLAAVLPKHAITWTVALAVLVSLAVVFALASLACITFASFPRVEGPSASLVFFGGVAQRTAEQFKDAVNNLSDEGYVDDLAKQCHRNAEIASRKFKWVQNAFFWLYLAVLPWGVSIFLLYKAWK